MANAYGLNDTGTGAVNPQFGAGAVSPNMATPPMMAEGGVIPDDEDMLGDDSPNTDITDYTGAMKIVREALNYGRQQHGLPASRPQQANDKEDDSAIPDEPESSDDNQEESTESYAEGGAIEDDDVAAHELEFPDDLPPESEYPPAERGLLQRDIDASNNATPDREQYGRPVVVDDPDAVHPPVSGNNLSEEDIRRGLAATSGDNSGAAPVVGAIPDDSGAAPAGGVAPTEPSLRDRWRETEATGQDPSDPNRGDQRVNPELAISYLQGKGAAPMETLAAYREQAAGKTIAEKNLLAVAAAPEQARFPLEQTMRGIYNSSIGHAFAAFNGVEGKPADLNAAAASATKAYDNLLDGVSTTFKADGNNIVAHVKPPGADQAQTFHLTPQQFGSLLDPGKGGMYDGLLEGGGAMGVLKKAATPETAAPAQSRGTAYVGANGLARFRAASGGSAGGAVRPWGGTLNSPEVGWDKEATRELGQPNDRGPNGVNTGPFYRDVTLIRTPGYKKMQADQGNTPIVDRRGYTRGYNNQPGTSDFDVPPGKTRNDVRVLGGDKERTFRNGVDVTPDREQQNKLEQIRARNEGRSGSKTQRDYMAEIKAKHEARMEELKLQDEGKTSRATAGIGARTKMAADKLLEQAKERESREGRNAASNAERLLVGKMLNGKELTPEEQALAKQMGQRASQALAPSPRQPAAPAAPQQKQMSAQDQAAIAWANANPTDPRAARIKQLHGIQ